MGEHIELADLATFLISDQASYINGEVVTIDGGEWLKELDNLMSLKSASNCLEIIKHEKKEEKIVNSFFFLKDSLRNLQIQKTK